MKKGDGPKKKKKGRMHVHEQKRTDTIKKNGMHDHEKSGWTKKKKDRCMSIKNVDGPKKKKREGCMSMNKSGRTPKKKLMMHVCEQSGWTKKKNIDDEVTLSHVSKSTTESRRTKYLKNGTLIKDYNMSRMLEVRASRVPGAMYQWSTMQKDAQSNI